MEIKIIYLVIYSYVVFFFDTLHYFVRNKWFELKLH